MLIIHNVKDAAPKDARRSVLRSQDLGLGSTPARMNGPGQGRTTDSLAQKRPATRLAFAPNLVNPLAAKVAYELLFIFVHTWRMSNFFRFFKEDFL